MPVAIRAITRLQDADDASLFAGQGWLNVRDYGATGDGITDDTTAIQAAIDAAGAAGGGTVFFPAGTYIVAGALQDTGGANAQLVLPSVTTPTGPGYTIQLAGPTIPVAHYWYPNSSTVTPTDGAIIKSTLSSGNGALIGGYNSNPQRNITFVTLAIVNMRLRMPANPSNSCLDLSRVACVDLAHVIVDAGEYDTSQIAQPTTTSSYGIKMPSYNNGATVAANGVTVIGFYTGMQIGEHQTGDQLHAAGCYYAFEFPFTYHSTRFGRIIYQNCKNGLRFVGDKHYTVIAEVNVERTNDEAKWYYMAADVVDPNNYGYGSLAYHVVQANAGVVTTFDKSGGANLTCSRIGAAATGATPPTFSSAEVGTVDASTVVVTFSEAIKAANYATGVTINVEGTPATISSATRQTNKAIVYYTLSAPVTSGETVTWAYAAVDGFIADAAGAHLADVAAQAVTNNVVGGSVDLLTGLAGWWELSEANGTRYDSTDNNLDLTDNNTVTQAVGVGGSGNAAQFASGNLETLTRTSEANLVVGDIDFTVAAWVYLDSKSAEMRIITKVATDWEYALDYHNTSDRFRFFGYAPGNSPTVSADDFGSPATGTWYLVVAWNDQDGDTVNIQVNNGTVTTAPKGAATFVTGIAVFGIGGNAVDVVTWNGRIAKVGLWKRLLTTDERTALYNSGNGATYPFA